MPAAGSLREGAWLSLAFSGPLCGPHPSCCQNNSFLLLFVKSCGSSVFRALCRSHWQLGTSSPQNILCKDYLLPEHPHCPRAITPGATTWRLKRLCGCRLGCPPHSPGEVQEPLTRP